VVDVAARAEIGAAVGGRVGAAPVLGGDVGAVVVDTLQAASNAEADGKPRPTAATRCRNTRRAICTALCYLRPIAIIRLACPFDVDGVATVLIIRRLINGLASVQHPSTLRRSFPLQ
jgi:hypothetical protein